MNARPLWHQFRKETREHLWFVLGYGTIIAIYATLGATSVLESATNSWGRPLLMDNEDLALFISLLPAIFFAPFVAFADPADSPEAFWLTKPPRAAIVVGGKLLWIAVWLIAMPMIGECVIVIALGGAKQAIFVAMDFVWLRAAFVVGAFALGAVASHPLKFVFAAMGIPVFLELFDAFLVSVLGVSLSTGIPYAASIALSWVWIGIISVGAAGVAFVQYRWRKPLAIGLPTTLAAITLAIVVEHQEVDLTNPPGIATNSPFSQVTLKLENIAIDQGDLSPHRRNRSYLEADATFGNIPHTSTVGIVELDLTLSADGCRHRIKHFSSDWKRFDEKQRDRRRVFREIGERIKNGPQSTTTTLRGRIRIPLPHKLDPELPNTASVEISGNVRVDCFDHQDFGILKPALFDGPTFPPSNRRVSSTLQKDNVLLTLLWPVAPANQRQVPVQIRHISTAALHGDNAEPWTRSHNHVVPWYFIPRDSTTDAIWSRYDDQYVEANHASPRTALHLNRAWFTIPTSFPADEIVVFKARHVGQRTIQIATRSNSSR